MSDLFDFTVSAKHCVVMGNPVAHSKSPRIHALFAEQCGIAVDYQAQLVDPGGFEAAVRNFHASGGTGANITVPFKEDAFRLADSLSERARIAGAVNTLVFNSDGTIYGDNTDGIGLVRDLRDNLGAAIEHARVLILGAGGAVRGVLGPLLAMAPGEIRIANRTVDRAAELAAVFAENGNISASGYSDVEDEPFDLIINGTSLSLSGQMPPLRPSLVGPDTLAYDMGYGDEPTVFMQWCTANGGGSADGLGMLVEQAAESFFIWHGEKPRTAPVLAALRNP